MRRAWRLAWCVLPLLFAAAVGSGVAPELEPVLQRLQKAAEEIQTLAGSFVQEKRLAMLKEPLVSRGRLYYARPDRLRWEVTEPVARGFALTGRTGRRWHQRGGSPETFHLDRNPAMQAVAEQLFAWVRFDLVRLRLQYRITVLGEHPVALRLEPVPQAESGILRRLDVAFSGDGTHVECVEFTERDGDVTRITFTEMVLNAPLSADLF